MGAVVAIAAAQRVRQERELIDHLRERQAFSAASATDLRPQRRMGQTVLQSLVRNGAVLQTGAGLYWLDETAYQAVRANRQRNAVRASLIVTAACVAIVVLVLLLSPR